MVKRGACSNHWFSCHMLFADVMQMHRCPHGCDINYVVFQKFLHFKCSAIVNFVAYFRMLFRKSGDVGQHQRTCGVSYKFCILPACKKSICGNKCLCLRPDSAGSVAVMEKFHCRQKSTVVVSDSTGSDCVFKRTSVTDSCSYSGHRIRCFWNYIR